MVCEQEERYVLAQGNDTNFEGKHFITDYFDTDLDMTGFTANCEVPKGNVKKDLDILFDNKKQKWYVDVDFTAAETLQMPLGDQFLYVTVFNTEEKQQILRKIPIKVLPKGSTGTFTTVEHGVVGQQSHTRLIDRELPDQHPISAITNLENTILSLEEKDQSQDTIINEHIDNINNPHNVTKEQVGLGNVDNTSDLSKPISIRTQEALNTKVDKTTEANKLYGTDNEGNQTTYDKPVIGDATLTVQRNGTSVGTFTANATSNKNINIEVPTKASDVGALPDTTKYGATLVLTMSQDYVVSITLKDQEGNTLGTTQTVDLPLESVVVGGSYDSVNKEIVLTLDNGDTINIPVADLVSGLQSEITVDNKLNADLVDDSEATHKFVTSGEKNTWNGKQDELISGTNIKTLNNNSILGEGNIDIDALPSQTGQSGKFLTTNGTAASWGTIDLSNKIDKGYAVNDFATNCITEISQDINLTLENGTLTLKSGTKFYTADGGQYSLTSDATISSGSNGVPYFIFPQTGGTATRAQVALCYSGPTAPTVSGGAIWLDTTNNVIKQTSDGGNTWTNTSYGLPIGICTSGSGSWTSIDQVFNGFGYIGHHAFALPGIKILAPNGLNSDGTLKTVIGSNTSLRIRELTNYDNGVYNSQFAMSSDGGVDRWRGYFQVANEAELEQTISGMSNYNSFRFFVRDKNILKTNNAGTWYIQQQAPLARYAMNSNQQITLWEPHPVCGLSKNYINTALGYTPAKSTDVGTLSELTTTNKTSLVSAINEVNSFNAMVITDYTT